MEQVFISLVTGAIGALIGGYVSYRVATRAARSQARREALAKAVERLQDYKVAYAQWYVEYLSPHAVAAGRKWAKTPSDTVDKTCLDMMGAVDRGRGSLRGTHAMLVALFPGDVIRPVCEGISEVLHLSGSVQSDLHEVDRVADAVCELIPPLIRNHCW